MNGSGWLQPPTGFSVPPVLCAEFQGRMAGCQAHKGTALQRWMPHWRSASVYIICRFQSHFQIGETKLMTDVHLETNFECVKNWFSRIDFLGSIKSIYINAWSFLNVYNPGSSRIDVIWRFLFSTKERGTRWKLFRITQEQRRLGGNLDNIERCQHK